MTKEGPQRALAGEHAAWRRVPPVVAPEPSPHRVFAQVTQEVAMLLRLPAASVMQFDGPRTARVVGAWSVDGRLRFPVGGALELEGDMVVAKVRRTGSPQRVERYEEASAT